MFPLILSLLCANACNAQSLDVQLSLKSKLAQNTYSGTFDITQSKQLHISTEKVDSSDGTISVTIDMLKNKHTFIAQVSISRETGDGKSELLAEPILVLDWDAEGVITIGEKDSANPSSFMDLALRMTAHK